VLGALRLVLGDEEHIAGACRRARTLDQLGDDVGRARIEDALRRIQAESIEVELTQPVIGVADHEIARTIGVLAIEVERLTPLRSMALAEVVRTEALQVVAVGPEMVVDDIEDHCDATRMRCIDEALSGLIVAVHVIRRE
jgi:hypothetical protein